jgi:hypothetical protein
MTSTAAVDDTSRESCCRGGVQLGMDACLAGTAFVGIRAASSWMECGRFLRHGTAEAAMAHVGRSPRPGGGLARA